VWMCIGEGLSKKRRREKLYEWRNETLSVMPQPKL
jgi:hypothetical protein